MRSNADCTDARQRQLGCILLPAWSSHCRFRNKAREGRVCPVVSRLLERCLQHCTGEKSVSVLAFLGAEDRTGKDKREAKKSLGSVT